MDAAEFVDGLDSDKPGAAEPPPLPDYVELDGGLTLPTKAVQLAWTLEGRGFRLRIENDELKIGAPPSGTLSDDDRKQLKTYRAHVKALVAYVAPRTP